MQSKAATVREYLAALPAERRRALETVRAVILKNLDADYEEGMQYGMIGYYVPHRVFPAGYHCDPRQPLPFAALASQKNYMSLYLMCVYGSTDHARWFTGAWKVAGKKLDMGKSCVRFRSLDEVPLDVVGEAIRRVPAREFIANYEAAMSATSKRSAARPKIAAGSAKVKAPAPRASDQGESANRAKAVPAKKRIAKHK